MLLHHLLLFITQFLLKEAMKPFQSEAKASAQESKCPAREIECEHNPPQPPYQEAKRQSPTLHVAMTPCGRNFSAQTVRKLTLETSQRNGKRSREGLLL